MKKTALFIAGIMLVGMAPPDEYADMDGIAMADGYPPCSATVTDRCIQLYERGVNTRTNLALNRNMGARASAMGGPYEPAASDGSTNASWQTRSRRSGYPPCSRSPDDDRCIQLYERGVTGAGN